MALRNDKIADTPTLSALFRPATWLALLLGAYVVVWMNRELFVAQAQSFDPLLYSRSLWGLSHGSLENPIIDLHAFAIHGHFLQILLVPLAWLMPAARALALGQGAALAATALIIAHHLTLPGKRGHSSPPSPMTAAWAALLLLLGSPLATNPFMFDVRPDLLGIPFLVAALLRMSDEETLSPMTLVLLALGSLAREEFALCSAFALFFPPRPRATWRLDRGPRVVASIAFALYFALYYFGIRAWLGGTSESAGLHLSGGGATPPWSDWFVAKLHLMIVFIGAAGGVALIAPRLLVLAIPGLFLLFSTRWMLNEQLRFHYSMFIAPALIAAGTVGVRRLHERLSSPARMSTALFASAVGVALFVWRSAWPGGGHFQRGNFELSAAQAYTFQSPQTRPFTAQAHAALAKVPRSQSISVPWHFATPLADRTGIYANEMLWNQLLQKKLPPQSLTDMAVQIGDPTSTRLGRWLVQNRAFKMVGSPTPPFVLLTSDAKRQAIPWQEIQNKETNCTTPIARFPEAGITLCAVNASDTKPPTVTLLRESFVAGPLAAFIKTETRPLPLWLAGGLVNLGDLPVGSQVTLAADLIRANTVQEDIVLVNKESRPIEREVVTTKPSRRPR